MKTVTVEGKSYRLGDRLVNLLGLLRHPLCLGLYDGAFYSLVKLRLLTSSVVTVDYCDFHKRVSSLRYSAEGHSFMSWLVTPLFMCVGSPDLTKKDFPFFVDFPVPYRVLSNATHHTLLTSAFLNLCRCQYFFLDSDSVCD